MLKLLYKIRLAFIAVILPATVLLFYNNDVNRHYHYTSNGNLVIVAHPFNKLCKNPLQPNHTSSKNELIKLSNLLFSFTTGANPVNPDLSPNYFEYKKVYHFLQRKYIIFEISRQNRAPPILFI